MALRAVLCAAGLLAALGSGSALALDAAKPGGLGTVDLNKLEVGGTVTIRGDMKTLDGTIVGGIENGVYTSSPPALSVRPSGRTAAPILNLRINPPANGLFSRGDGTLIDFCSQTGCLPNYPGLLAQTFLQATTRLDNAQEITLHTNLRSRTGFSPKWKPSTKYTNAQPSRPDQISLVVVDGGFAGNLYKNVSGPCVSAASGPGPQGTDAKVDIQDGTCRWRWHADGLNAGKSNLSVATVAEPGAAQTWGLVTAFNAGSGIGDVGMFPHEFDCNNYNKDSFLGSPFFMNCFYMGGGGDGTFPMFSAFYLDNANKNRAGQAGYNYGLWFSGGSEDAGTLVREATIFDATKSKYTLQALSGQPKAAFLRDDSASQTVLQVTGKHQYGVDLSNATFSSGFPLALPTSGFISFKNGLGAALGYSGGKLQYGPNSGMAAFTIDDAGNVVAAGSVTASGRLNSPLATPASSKAPCAPGDWAHDADFVYTCVAANRWKRAALSSW